jgi:PIN domain nuclease of toxin-antitoxin system
LNVLLDTHAVLWWQAGGQRLSKAAAAAIDRAEVIHLSPVTFWEIATLRRLGRVELDRDLGVWVHDLLRQPRIAVAALTPEAAAWAGDLGSDFPGDPIDRLLLATARDMRVPMVSKDQRLRDYSANSGDVEFIW